MNVWYRNSKPLCCVSDRIGLIFRKIWFNSIDTFHFCILYKQHFHFSFEGNANVVAIVVYVEFQFFAYNSSIVRTEKIVIPVMPSLLPTESSLDFLSSGGGKHIVLGFSKGRLADKPYSFTKITPFQNLCSYPCRSYLGFIRVNKIVQESINDRSYENAKYDGLEIATESLFFSKPSCIFPVAS